MLTKMKRISCIVCLIVIALLPSCKGTVDSPDKPVNADPSAVGFNVYVNRGLQTKAGWGGVLTLDDLKDGTKANGFGVFAYYGNGALYNETSKPDFMYDQQVTYNTTNNVWGYSPVKYWPNEFGEAASSEAADRLTFFAYAPFADVTPSTGVVTGDATTGIIGMSRNISAGDPVVMYSSSLTPGAGVDLCWGVAAEAFTSSVDGDNNNVAAGYPFLNVIKPKTGDHLKFEFNHALAQLNVQIDADIDEVAADGKTKIYVRSVTFNGFSMRGSLNLNSNTTDGPIWYDISGTGKLKREPVTVYDGRTDGMEGVETATDMSEKPANLNPVIVQDKPYDVAQLSAGVTTTAVNLFNNVDENAPVMVIPTPGVPVSVTIVYDVETKDSRLAGLLSDGVTHGSSVENKITKTITTDQGNMILSAGKKYVVKLHLGLTSVKFDAEVANWDNTTYEGSGYLPENTELLGTVTITDGSSSPTPISLTALTMWKGETMATAPGVIVKDEHGDTITGYDVEWTSSNTNVATVAADGTVTPVAPGTATITVKVSKDGKIASKSYTMYVNELTGISITSTATDIAVGGTLPVKATLEINSGNAVNGDIAPSVTWTSSASAKISVTSPVTAVKEGDDYVSTTTATAETAAVLGDQAVITATIGSFSDDVTLTCTDSRTVTGVTLGTSSTTVWRCEGYTVPTVTVQGTEDSDLTSLATVTWKVNGNPVTVTNGKIPLPSAGELTVTATASYNNSDASASVTVYANEVTGITVAPASVNVLKGATTTLTATLTNTGYGDGTALTDPVISWSSGSTSYVSVSPATGTSTTATGVNTGSSTVTATFNADYKQSGADNSASCTVKCVTPSATAFRGYEVSTGILQRTKEGDAAATYSLTSGAMVKNATNGEYSLPAGCNPFEPAVYYGNSASLNTYFNKWHTLKDELGADGNNINASSDKLPTGWKFPSAGGTKYSTGTDWGNILFGQPKTPITVNGTIVTKIPNKQYYTPFVFVSVNLESGNSFGVAAKTYYGIFLLRDGSTIPTGYFTKIGLDGKYTDNPLTEAQFNDLVRMGCLFISASGYYSEVFTSWRDLDTSWQYGCYWSSNYVSTNSFRFFKFSNASDTSVAASSTEGNKNFFVVKLVKLVTP